MKAIDPQREKLCLLLLYNHIPEQMGTCSENEVTQNKINNLKWQISFRYESIPIFQIPFSSNIILTRISNHHQLVKHIFHPHSTTTKMQDSLSSPRYRYTLQTNQSTIDLILLVWMRNRNLLFSPKRSTGESLAPSRRTYPIQLTFTQKLE